MRSVIQRVSAARVVVAASTIGQIGAGLLVLLAVRHDDNEEDARWLANKIAALRVFDDADGKMNRSVVDVGGAILVVSQFTLLASTRKGVSGGANAAR